LSSLPEGRHIWLFEFSWYHLYSFGHYEWIKHMCSPSKKIKYSAHCPLPYISTPFDTR
jgi:hypothetical protein